MKVLIVAATLLEIKPFLDKMSSGYNPGSRIHRLKGGDHEVTVLITGVGMTATAFHMGRTLADRSYELAVNVGLAGSFDRSLSMGDVVQVISDRFAEMGAEDGDGFLSINDLGLLTEFEHPITEHGLINNQQPFINHLNHFPKVTGITVNKVHGWQASIDLVQQRYNPQVETMEGAAFLFACLSEKINCLQIRAISNYVEKRNRDNWNIPLAVKNLNAAVEEVLISI